MVALGFALSTPLVLLTPPALRMAPPTMQFAPHPDRFRGRAYVSGGDLVEPGPAGVTTSTGGGGALHEINEYYQRGNAAERRGYAEPPPGMYQEERPRRPARLAERMRTEQAQGQGGPSGMDMRPGSLSVDVAGYIPTNAHPDAVSAFGIFYDTGRMVNGKPAYVNAQQSDVMLYWSPKGDWIIGLKREIGTGATMTGFARSMDRGAESPFELQGKWKILEWNGGGWINNVDLRITGAGQPPMGGQPQGPPMAPGMGVMAPGMQGMEMPGMQMPPPGYGGMPPPSGDAPMGARVATARQALNAAAADKYRALIRPAFDAYSADEIEESALMRAKAAAREGVREELTQVAALDAAFAEYEKAVAAVGQVTAMQSHAVAALDAALRAVEKEHTVAPLPPMPSPMPPPQGMPPPGMGGMPPGVAPTQQRVRGARGRRYSPNTGMANSVQGNYDMYRRRSQAWSTGSDNMAGPM